MPSPHASTAPRIVQENEQPEKSEQHQRVKTQGWNHSRILALRGDNEGILLDAWADGILRRLEGTRPAPLSSLFPRCASILPVIGHNVLSPSSFSLTMDKVKICLVIESFEY
jgi:hypothetical protein